MSTAGFEALIGLSYLLGASVLGHGTWVAVRSARAARWPITRGVLREVRLHRDADGDDLAYEVKVRYAYGVGGRQFEGTRLAFGYAASRGREAHEAIRRRLEGAESVEVRYAPGCPATSVLSCGVHRWISSRLAFGALWLAFTALAHSLWRLSAGTGPATFTALWLAFAVAFVASLWWFSADTDDVLPRNLTVR